MTKMTADNAIDLAVLPLHDGRQVIMPLVALAEVRQISANHDHELGTVQWRGHELPISSLDVFCGLPAAAIEQHTTVGIFRAGEDSGEPFRALAFCGLASHKLAGASDMVAVDVPTEGNFTAAAEVDGEVFLLPDLPGLMYGGNSGKLH
jgi:hypothetical protein